MTLLKIIAFVPVIMVCLTFITLLIIYIINTITNHHELQINSDEKEKEDEHQR